MEQVRLFKRQKQSIAARGKTTSVSATEVDVEPQVWMIVVIAEIVANVGLRPGELCNECSTRGHTQRLTIGAIVTTALAGEFLRRFSSNRPALVDPTPL